MITVMFSGWPGQKRSSPQLGRFGGGWHYKLGVALGHGTLVIDLLLGSVYISWGKNR